MRLLGCNCVDRLRREEHAPETVFAVVVRPVERWSTGKPVCDCIHRLTMAKTSGNVWDGMTVADCRTVESAGRTV